MSDMALIRWPVAKPPEFPLRLMAERMALPMTYIRKKPKGYGRNARIEGLMSEGQNVLLVEDLTTDGGSKLSFVDAIREAPARPVPIRR